MHLGRQIVGREVERKEATEDEEINVSKEERISRRQSQKSEQMGCN